MRDPCELDLLFSRPADSAVIWRIRCTFDGLVRISCVEGILSFAFQSPVLSKVNLRQVWDQNHHGNMSIVFNISPLISALIQRLL